MRRSFFCYLMIFGFLAETVQPMALSCVDVGQGNCTLILPKKTSSPLVLVDCGSSSNKARAIASMGNREKLTKNITSLVMDCVKTNTRELLIIISHADDDHYNLLAPLTASFINNRKYLALKQILLGGEKTDYTARVLWRKKRIPFSDFLKDLTKNHGVDVAFPSELATTCNTLKPLSSDFNFIVLFIPTSLKSKCDIKKDDKNAMSLIVQVCFGNKRVLLQGDATDKTTAYHLKVAKKAISPSTVQSVSIIPNYQLTTLHENDLPSDIVLASHHGASAGCNGLEWLEKISPKFIILSSGVDTQYRHPREETVRRCLETLSDDSGPLHSLYYGLQNTCSFEEQPNDLYHGEFGDGYAVTLTRKNLYGTLGQGTIIFDFDPVKPIQHPTFSRPFSSYGTQSSGEAILTRCNPESPEGTQLRYSSQKEPLKDACLAFDALVCLNLSNLDLSQATLELAAFQLFEHLCSSNHEVQALYLNNTRLGESNLLVNKLKEVVEKNEKIFLLYLKNALSNAVQEQEIKDSWGYRGLTIQ